MTDAHAKPHVEHRDVDGLPTPKGHYSHIAVGQGLVYVSGQLPVDAQGSPRADLSFADQATLALRNVATALGGAGCDWHDVLKVTVYVAGIEHWKSFDEAYRQVVGTAKPARAVVPVPELHYGVLVEIEAVAAQKAR